MRVLALGSGLAMLKQPRFQMLDGLFHSIDSIVNYGLKLDLSVM